MKVYLCLNAIKLILINEFLSLSRTLDVSVVVLINVTMSLNRFFLEDFSGIHSIQDYRILRKLTAKRVKICIE